MTSTPNILSDAHYYLARCITTLLEKASPRTKYAIEITVRLPMLFLIHQWLLLSPRHDQTIPNLFVFVLRALGCIYMLGCLEMQKVNLLFSYSAMIVDILLAWKVELSYRWINNEISKCDNITAPCPGTPETFLWTIGDVILLQTCYIIYITLRYKLGTCFGIACIVIHFIFCSVYLFWGFITLPYLVYKYIFLIVCMVQMLYRLDKDERVQLLSYLSRFGIPLPLPGKWIWRDLCTVFAVLYFSTCFLADLIRDGREAVLTPHYWLHFMGNWSTSLAIIISLASLFGSFTTFVIEIGRFIVANQMQLRKAFDDYNGQFVEHAMVIISIQVGILSPTHLGQTDTNRMPLVLLMILFLVICMVWRMAKDQLLYLLTTGDDGCTCLAFFRVVSFMAFLIAGPSYLNYYIASSYGINLWSLVNITGNAFLLAKAFSCVIECSLLQLSSFLEDGVERLSDAIYYTRLVGGLFDVVFTFSLSYYRFTSPYFTGPAFIKWIAAACDCLSITFMVTIAEWNNYTERQRLIKQMNYIPEATVDQIKGYDNDCAVCLDKVTKGKRLQCGHIYHTTCLRKWFQVRTTCPLCNTDVHAVTDGFDIV